MRIGLIAIIALIAACALVISGGLPALAGNGTNVPNPPKGNNSNKTETDGNCLSFPVIWGDANINGVDNLSTTTLPLRGTYDIPLFKDEWWYVWGINATGDPLSCLPNPDDLANCSDGTVPGGVVEVGDVTHDVQIVYLQQKENNTWQAENATPESRTNVSLVDWGDNLETKNWTDSSIIRTEVVLFQNVSEDTMEGFNMFHVYDHGADEMWGTNGTTYDSSRATVYSGCARFTIQSVKNRGDLDHLIWNSTTGEWDCDSISCDISYLYNDEVWDGPISSKEYSAEINVGGKVMYGYNWDIDKVGTGQGWYRLTFSLDPLNCPVTLNTFFTDDTQIMEVVPGASGGVAAIDHENNLTYIDIFIVPQGNN